MCSFQMPFGSVRADLSNLMNWGRFARSNQRIIELSARPMSAIIRQVEGKCQQKRDMEENNIMNNNNNNTVYLLHAISPKARST